MQLIKLTLQLCSLSETFLKRTFDAASHLYSYTIHPWQFGLHADCYRAAGMKREESLLEIVEKRGLLFIHFLSSKPIMEKKGGKIFVLKVGSNQDDPSNIYLE